MDGGRDALGKLPADACARFDRAAELVHLPDPHELDAELFDLLKSAHDRLDSAREDVDAAHRDHVVDTADDPALQLEERPAARASLAYGPHAVAGAVADCRRAPAAQVREQDRKSTRLNSSHVAISYAV